MQDIHHIISRLEALSVRCDLLQLDKFLQHRADWKRRLLIDFFCGVLRGVGFFIGFSLLGAVVIYLLRNAALANLPVIGQFLAELLRIAESNH